MKKVLMIFAGFALCAFIGTGSAMAQTPMSEKKVPIGMSVGIKSNHLWRGYEVSNSAAFTGDLFISTRDESFKFGIWGGNAFNGSWKEFDYYMSYSIGRFTIALWDIFNFSPGADYSTDVFNYKARQTGHFIDLSLAYRLPDAFPLGISVATILAGRDRGPYNDKQLYSTYVTLDYPLLRSKLINLDIACSGAFALARAKDPTTGKKLDNNFYADNDNIVNVSLTASHTFTIGKYELPVSILGMWNPARDYGHMQLALTLLQF